MSDFITLTEVSECATSESIKIAVRHSTIESLESGESVSKVVCEYAEFCVSETITEILELIDDAQKTQKTKPSNWMDARQ